MEVFKKLIVLLTSIVIIALVAYFVSISSSKKTEQIAAGDSAAADLSGFETAAEDSISSPGAVEEPSPPITKEVPSGDSVNWQHFNDRRMESENKVGSSTPGFNPNKLFTKAAKRILPAVVSIRSTQVFKLIPEDHPEFYHPGSGSGIIISKNGYVLTNFHVINEAKELHITLYDMREFPAQYVGADPTTDVALLKIDANDLPAAYMGNSDETEIGEWVLAVGNPLNFRSTITAGIVSAIGRDINIIDEEYRIENFIQTDAVINPGNSGGALVNLNGEVVGVNTAIATRTGFNQGYGFAIPINLAKKVVDDIVQYGYVKRGLLGISIGRVSSGTARAMGLSVPKGVLIQGVRKDFPAEKIGLKQGDIILSVNGEAVNAPNELQMKIARNHPGTKVNLGVWRNGKETKFEVVLAEAPQSDTKSLLSLSEDNIRYENLGLLVRDLTRAEREYLDEVEGVLVERVYSGSPAQNAGIVKADVIVSIDENGIKSKGDFEKHVKQASSGDVLKFQLVRKLENEGIYNRIVFVEVP
jgi:serine protease Do